ncbi:MAG: HEPN domain-containing protein [Candidatus Woesearchaeota archaeon]
MKKENHLEKAKRIEMSFGKLDKEKDWELIVEGIYGAAQHFISYYCDLKIGKHIETHKGLIRFLKEENFDELANKFQRLDELRIGKWYGNQVNGETVELAFEVLKEIKNMIKDEK